MVGVVGEQHVRIVAVVDVSGVGAQRQEAAVGQRHPHARRKEALAVLDLLGVADLGDVAEIAVAEIPDREIVGIVEEYRLPRVEIRPAPDRSPGVDRPQVEVCAQLLRDAADVLVIDADIGLVEGRRGDVSPKDDLEIGPRAELGLERITFPDGVVAHGGEVHREIAAGKHLEEIVFQLLEAHRPLNARRAAVHLHEIADILPLGALQPFEFVVVEDQRRTLGAERLATPGVVGRVAAFGDFLQQLRHGCHGVLITCVHNRLGLVEIEHVDPHGAADRDAALLGQRVVGIVHGQHESLVHDVALLAGRGVALGADRTDDQIGPEIFVEGFPREVVVDAAVVEQHRIFHHRLEHQRNGHRRADRLAQIPLAQDHRPAVVQVAGHAEERNHQAVEITVRSGRRRSEQLREGHVDLRRGDQVPGYAQPLPGGTLDVDAQAQKRGIAPHLPVIGHVFVGVDAPRDPLLDHPRVDDRTHFGRGISCGVHRGDDRTHRGPGHIVDRHAVLFERFQNADMVKPLRTAAAHHDPDLLGRGGERGQQARQDK